MASVIWQTRPVLLEGLDSKSDPKSVLDGKLLTLENGVWARPGAINKRADLHTQFGSTSPVYSVHTGYDSRYTRVRADTSALAACVGLFKFRDGLVHLNGARLRTSDDGTFWIDRGPLIPSRVQIERDILPELFRSGAAFERVYVDCAYTNGIFVVAGYIRSVDAGDPEYLRVAVFKGVGGPLLRLNEHGAAGDLLPNTLRCVAIGTTIHILHQDGATLHDQIVDTANPTTAPTHTVVVAAAMSAASTRSEFDAYANPAGTAAYVAYRTAGAPNTVSLVVINSAGAVTAGPEVVYNGGSTVGSYIAVGVTAANQVFVAYTAGTATYVRGYTSALAALFASVAITAAAVPPIWVMESTTTNKVIVAMQNTRDVLLETVSNVGATSYPWGVALYDVGYLCSRPWYSGTDLLFGIMHIKPSTPSCWDPCVSLFQLKYNDADFIANTEVAIQARFLESAVLDAEPMASNVITASPGYHMVLPGLFASGGLESPAPGACRVVIDLANPVPRVVEHGGALHISGGQLWEFGGEYVVEAHLRNTAQYVGGDIAASYGGAGATIPNGVYWVAQVLVWKGANGRLYKAAPTKLVSVTVAGGVASYVRVTYSLPATPSHRRDGELHAVTYMSETDGSVLYEVADTIVSAEYSGAGTSYVDITAQPAGTEPMLYTTGGILPHFPPPGAWNLCTKGNRLFAACNDGHVHYTKELADGESAAQFCDEFVKMRPGADAEPFYVAEMDGNVFAFHKKGIAVFSGAGPNDQGLGDFTDFQEIAVDVLGISDYTKGVPVKSDQGLYFWTDRGPMLLNRQLQVEPVGLAIETACSGLTCLDIVPLPKRYQIWFLTSAKMFVFDYLMKRWSTFPLSYTAVGMVEIDNSVYIAGSDGKVYKERASTFLATDILKFRTGWIKPQNYFGEFRVKKMILLGTKKSNATITVRVYFDYSDTYAEEHTLAIGTPWTSEPGELVVPLDRQRCQAVSFEVYDGTLGGTNEGITVSGMSLEIGLMKDQIVKVPATKITS